MDPIQSALCLLLGFAIPTTALFLILRRGMRQLSVSAAYGEVSRRLGLDVDTRGTSLQGHLGERRIWIGSVMVGHGPERQMMTWGVLDLTRPLGLGLLVRRKGRTTRILRRAPAPDAPIGDAELDRAFEVQGDDPGRVRALFTPAVRASLHQLMDSWPEIALTDRAVRVHLNAPETSTQGLENLVATMLGMADALESARREVPAPSRVLPDLPHWEALGRTLSLEVEPWLPALSGEFEGYRMLVSTRRSAAGYAVGLRLWFRPHRHAGLRLRQQTEPDGYWSVGQDIQVADQAFDAAFVIKGWDPQAIVELLNDEVRASLLALSEHGQPEVDDRCLYVEGLPRDPAVVEQATRDAVRVAKALDW